MKRKAAALALTVAMIMAVSGSVYAEPKSTEVEPGITGNPEESDTELQRVRNIRNSVHTKNKGT